MPEDMWEMRREGATQRPDDRRSAFQRDHARLIHSSAFRRLQSKTQVLGLGESDFYRTRLTHTMEVAQIGTAINERLKATCSDEFYAILPPRALMNAVCLAHDIGHPPFGHGGEVALNRFMVKHGKVDDQGFEGNGQTLRVLARLDKYSKALGLNPTRRMLLGVLKYPARYTEVVNQDRYPDDEVNYTARFRASEWKPPKCYFDADRDVVEWILDPLKEGEKAAYCKVVDQSGSGEHGDPANKCLDTSIMDIADDIAYGVHDLEDSIAVGMVNRRQWEEFVCGEKKGAVCSLSPETGFEEITENLFGVDGEQRKNQIGSFVNTLITNVKIVESGLKEKSDLGILQYVVDLPGKESEGLKVLRDFIVTYVIRSRSVQLLEFKGQKVVSELADLFCYDPERFLPESTLEKYRDEGENVRVICDYIAGMTDDYAAKTYDKLFVTGRGSLFDRV